MQIDTIKLNERATKICTIFKANGFQAYIVGGCVRDLVLGLEPKDWDICTDAFPETIQKLFDKTYPTGLQHGTITVAMDGEHFEVTTFRTEGVYFDGRRPSKVTFVNNVVEDLARRDLTINAMAYDPIKHEFIDPFFGLDDIKNKLIRCVGNPLERLTEDALRILRIARFAARFGYTVDAETSKAMIDALPILPKISRERVKDEIWKILQTKKPSVGLILLHECGALQQIFYEWAGIKVKDAITQVDLCDSCDVDTKAAILCNWFSLAKLGIFVQELKLSNAEYKKIRFLLNAVEQYIQYTDHAISYYGVRCFFAWIKNNSPMHHEDGLNEFISFAEAIGFDTDNLFSIDTGTVWARHELAIDGNDAMALGYVGKDIKSILDDCYQQVLLSPDNNTREYLLSFAKK